MYSISVAGVVMALTETEIAAWATYRAQLRRGDLRADAPLVELIDTKTGAVLHSAAADGLAKWHEVGLAITPNNIIKMLKEQNGLSVDDIKMALAKAGYAVSGSKLQGWLSSPDNRKYQPMQLDELYLVLLGLEVKHG